jgi:hypothetical protein
MCGWDRTCAANAEVVAVAPRITHSQTGWLEARLPTVHGHQPATPQVPSR